MAPTIFFGWASADLPKEITVDCFLHTGVLVPLQPKPTSSLSEIKNVLFREAKHYPLFNRLSKPTSYCFVCVNEKGKRERLLDESLSLIDVKPFRPVLKLLERQTQETSTTQLDAKIKFLMRQTPAELEDNENDEVRSFRQKYLKLSLSESRKRRDTSWENRAMSTYPSDICDTPVPGFVLDKLNNGHYEVVVYLPPGDDHECLNIPLGIEPVDVVFVFKDKRPARKASMSDVKDYVIKIVGKQEYFLGKHNMEEFSVSVS